MPAQREARACRSRTSRPGARRWRPRPGSRSSGGACRPRCRTSPCRGTNSSPSSQPELARTSCCTNRTKLSVSVPPHGPRRRSCCSGGVRAAGAGARLRGGNTGSVGRGDARRRARRPLVTILNVEPGWVAARGTSAGSSGLRGVDVVAGRTQVAPPRCRDRRAAFGSNVGFEYIASTAPVFTSSSDDRALLGPRAASPRAAGGRGAARARRCRVSCLPLTGRRRCCRGRAPCRVR